MKLGMQVGLIPAGHIVLDGDSPPLTQRDTAPQFSTHLLWPNHKWLDGLRCQLHGMAQATLLDGDPAPLPKKGAEPPAEFLAHVHCGQTAEWIQTALGTEVGLAPGHIVLDGDPCSSPP